MKSILKFTDRTTPLGDILLKESRHVAEEHFESLAKSQFLGDNLVLCRILGGKKFFAFSNDFGLSPHLILDGFWEYWLTKYFAHVIKPGDTVIDIGANLGYYSVIAADFVGGTGRVVAVEPNPEVCSTLRQNVAINGFSSRTDVLNIALGGDEAAGSAPFFVPTGEPKNGRFTFEGEDHAYLSAHGDIFDVAIGRLAPEDFSRVDFIKIDVEGAEIGVLHSLRPIIERFKPKVVCEVNFGRGYDYAQVQEAIGTTQDLQFLDFDSKVKRLTKQMVEAERVHDDWLVCFG